MHSQDNQDTETVLAMYRAEYVRAGYMYSGECSPEYVGRVTELGFERALGAITALTDAGTLQRRQCQAWTYELVPAERRQLIITHKLAVIWQEEHGCFYPNHPDPRIGEVTRVMRETNAQVAP